MIASLGANIFLVQRSSPGKLSLSLWINGGRVCLVTLVQALVLLCSRSSIWGSITKQSQRKRVGFKHEATDVRQGRIANQSISEFTCVQPRRLLKQEVGVAPGLFLEFNRRCSAAAPVRDDRGLGSTCKYAQLVRSPIGKKASVS